LTEYGHKVILVHPKLKEIEGRSVLPSLSDITEEIDTLTLYVRPGLSEKMKDDIVALKPARVIMNPDTESDHLEQELLKAGITVVKACTLVLLKTNQY